MEITIQALKYGDRLHYEWKATVLEQTESYIIVLAKKGRELHHHTKQRVFTVPHWTIEFFPFDSWFTVSADIVDGQVKQYYCNINEPAKLSGEKVSFVDLDLDYVYRSGEWRVVDEDEFETHAVLFGYPEWLIHKARAELVQLQQRVQSNRFPFDGTLEAFIACIPEET
ncbi:DUF402 domain-containing protein [Paenibacillus sp. GD4]|uniref:DUF402 domain-containing protein n=1 Tax=Paenibacillus sp. GD4 TaxID=3068890 RepID=UPI002796E219|nr:DUF402 domain-containing protein [Paenibacillus sp. GD4]MDQ1913420.1 DUF402 domain-containing protein [Paenibacillus sp. GD4]